jgi:hypothetical protein
MLSNVVVVVVVSLPFKDTRDVKQWLGSAHSFVAIGVPWRVLWLCLLRGIKKK